MKQFLRQRQLNLGGRKEAEEAAGEIKSPGESVGLMNFNVVDSRNLRRLKHIPEIPYNLFICMPGIHPFVCLLSLQIVDGNSKSDVSNRREPGMFCGESEQAQTFISETSYVKVVFHTDNFTDQVRLQNELLAGLVGGGSNRRDLSTRQLGWRWLIGIGGGHMHTRGIWRCNEHGY